MKTFKVQKSTASVNGGFVVTLHSQGVVDEQGIMGSNMRRYVKHVNGLAIDSTLELDLTKYDEYRQQGTYVDPETGEERPYTMVWLMPKG